MFFFVLLLYYFVMRKFLTTPIYYVNAEPHIGSAYCTLATDLLARYHRKKLGNDNVFFLTGTDENSQKTVEAADKEGQEIYSYLEDMSNRWRATWDEIGVSYDDFIRTTEERHVETVHDLLNRMLANGDIYKGTYKGKYCTGCETFLKDTDLDENGHCPDHKKPPVDLEEENYFFKLSKYQKPLLDWYEKNPEWLRPAKRKNEILAFLNEGLEDISVSRETASMGIPMPKDDFHKIYVWIDALINYYSAVQGKGRFPFWSDAFHIIGKDISRFHCVIWPAILLSAGIRLPAGVFAHGFFTVNGEKMSKSLGNAISPIELSQTYGNDALRIGLLSAFEFGNDGDFSREHFDVIYNSQLAGGIGNLFNRVLVLIDKFLDGEKPKASTKDMTESREKIEEAFEKLELKKAIDSYFSVVGDANQLLNETEVWRMAKTDLEGAKVVFADLLVYLEFLAEYATVFLPEKAPDIQAMLGDASKIGKAGVLYPRVTIEG